MREGRGGASAVKSPASPGGCEASHLPSTMCEVSSLVTGAVWVLLTVYVHHHHHRHPVGIGFFLPKVRRRVNVMACSSAHRLCAIPTAVADDVLQFRTGEDVRVPTLCNWGKDQSKACQLTKRIMMDSSLQINYWRAAGHSQDRRPVPRTNITPHCSLPCQSDIGSPRLTRTTAACPSHPNTPLSARTTADLTCYAAQPSSGVHPDYKRLDGQLVLRGLYLI